MNRILWFGLGLGCVFSALGQNYPRTYGSQSGFGSVLFPGTGGPPPIRVAGAGYNRPYTGRPIGARPVSPQLNNGGRTIVVPYAYPVFVGGGGYGYGYGYGGDAPPPGYQQQPTQQVPTVIINQNFVPETVRPIVREYSDLPETAPSLRGYEAPAPAPIPAPDNPSPTVYLIAFTDHSIYSAIAYWVEGDTLNYVTPQGVHNRASLDLIDEAFSRQLNGERNVDFRLKK